MPDQLARERALFDVLDAAWRYIYSGEDRRQETYTAWRTTYREAFGDEPSSLVLPSRHPALIASTLADEMIARASRPLGPLTSTTTAHLQESD